MYPFKYNDGTEPRYGDIVSYHVWDSDDFATYTFFCILSTTEFIYISGGMDSGFAIGKKISFEEAIDCSENNDSSDIGFVKVGENYQLKQIIQKAFIN